MRFIDRMLSELTPELCEAELKRADAAHRAYANFIRSTKRVLEAKADLGDMGDGQEATAETEAAEEATQ